MDDATPLNPPAGLRRLLPDDRLARRAAAGDQRAFEAIYTRYEQDLYRFCLAMVGNPADAQEALQNTMVKALRGLRGEKREIKLKPWLYRIARNESVDTLRKRRDSVELEPDQAIAVGITETAETRERLRTLLADLEQLPERQRAALVMRELSGLDFAQIGAAFGSSAAVARQTLYEARLSLRQLETGREMPCADVMRELSDADGRVTRRREIRAHLRSCPHCRAFRDDIARRNQDLAALAPLPFAISAGLLRGVLGGQAGASGSGAASAGLAGTAAAGGGKAIATSAIVKSAATVAVAAVAGVSAADRGGLIDLHLPGGKDGGGEARATHVTSPASKAGSPKEETGTAVQAGQSAPARPQSAPTQPAGIEGGTGARPDASPGSGQASPQAASSPARHGSSRSASDRSRPPELPAAASHGQQTATAHKSENAPSAPGAPAKGWGKSNAGPPPREPAAKAGSPSSHSQAHSQPAEAPAAGGDLPAAPGKAHEEPPGPPRQPEG
ncbi:MAG TPA: sigma-70 family RNA polymerase sigma factor [Thermoanaerobaculia bacterium]